MAGNRGVVYVEPGKVEVRDISLNFSCSRRDTMAR